MPVNFIRAIRPLHWLKNLLVLTPVFFSGGLADPALILREMAAFVGFCLIASHIYVVNDIIDVDSDRANPAKSRRPFASGELSIVQMATLGAATCIGAGVIAFCIGPRYQLIILVYSALMYVYTLALKSTRIPGVVAISIGMMLRIFAGAVAIDAPVSAWVYPVAFLLSFYVVSGKRIFHAADGKGSTTLEKALFRVSGALTGVGYVAYCFSGVGLEKYGTSQMWITAPFVIAALYRYHVVVARPAGDREHLQSVLSDAPLLLIVVAWAAVFAALIYN